MGKGRVVVVVAALALLAVACDWSQAGFGPTHRSFNDTETSFTTANVADIELDWYTSFDVIQGHDLLSWGNHLSVMTATSGGSAFQVVVFAADGSSCAASPCTPQWRLPLGYGSAAVDGTTMFATTMTDATHARLAAFDANGTQGCSGTPTTCSPLWTATWTADSAGRPVVAGGRVYVASGGSTRVFDATGTTGCSSTTHTCTALFSLAGAESLPSVHDGLAFSSVGNHVLVYDATGATCSGPCTPLRRLAAGSAVDTPAIANGFVYASNASGLVVFDEKPAAPCPGSPATCSPRWTAPIAVNGSRVVTDTAVFVTGGGTLKAYDALGAAGCSGTPKVSAPIWQGSVPGFTFRNHAIATTSILFVDVLAVGGSDVEVVAFDVLGSVGCSGTPKTCTSLWGSDPVGDAYPLDLIAANGRIAWAYRDFGLKVMGLPG